MFYSNWELLRTFTFTLTSFVLSHLNLKSITSWWHQCFKRIGTAGSFGSKQDNVELTVNYSPLFWLHRSSKSSRTHFSSSFLLCWWFSAQFPQWPQTAESIFIDLQHHIITGWRRTAAFPVWKMLLPINLDSSVLKVDTSLVCQGELYSRPLE